MNQIEPMQNNQNLCKIDKLKEEFEQFFEITNFCGDIGDFILRVKQKDTEYPNNTRERFWSWIIQNFTPKEENFKTGSLEYIMSDKSKEEVKEIEKIGKYSHPTDSEAEYVAMCIVDKLNEVIDVVNKLNKL